MIRYQQLSDKQIMVLVPDELNLRNPKGRMGLFNYIPPELRKQFASFDIASEIWNEKGRWIVLSALPPRV